MNRSLRITVAFLGAYAGLLAIQHGIFAMLQGSHAPVINAIGPAMLAASGLLFLVFDVGLPVLSALSGYARSQR